VAKCGENKWLFMNGRSVVQHPLPSKERESGRFNQEICSMEISTFTLKGNKEGCMLCVHISKSIPKILTFNAVNNMKVAKCTTYFSVTNNAFSPQSASAYLFAIKKQQPLFYHAILI